MNVLVSFRVVALMLSFTVLAGCASNTAAPVVDRSQQPPGMSSTKAADAAKVGQITDRVARKGYYIVKPGDTLFRIALDHGQAYRDLAAWNSLIDPNRLEVGQELRVLPLEGDDSQAVAEAKPIGMSNAVEQRSLDGNTSAVKTQPKGGREAYSDEALARLGMAGDHGIVRIELPPDARPDVKVATPSAKSEDDVLWAWPATGKIGGQFVEGGSKGLDILGKKGDPVQAASDGKVVYSGSGLRGYGQLLIIKHNNAFLTAYAHNSKILVKEGQSVTRGQKIAEMGDTEADQVKLHFEVRRQGKPVDPLKHLPPR